MSAFEAIDLAERFSVSRVCSKILGSSFKKVVLQFPDDVLDICVEVHDLLLSALEASVGTETIADYDIFIAADSTYGSSVDDVSADHISADLLVYFGSDLSSSSSTMPVLIIPPKKTLDLDDCIRQYTSTVTSQSSENDAGQAADTVLILYEPAYTDYLPALQEQFPSPVFIYGTIPASLDDTNSTSKTTAEDSTAPLQLSLSVSIGGLLVDKESCMNITNNLDRSEIWYVGDKTEQLDSISLQFSQHTLRMYSPCTKQMTVLKGENTRVFRERYGGVSKVRNANVVGLIVGSMGLDESITKNIIHRATLLCEAAHKKTYTFIMGRLNEAKLCNFPEIDIFVFISNEDVSVIPPKTFHKPVITPWELELGLGARDWTSSYDTNPRSVLTDNKYDTNEKDIRENINLANAIEKVSESFADVFVDSDEDIGLDEKHVISLEEQDERYLGNHISREGTLHEGDIDDEDHGEKESIEQRSTALIKAMENRLMQYESPAAEFLKGREYQGLVPGVEKDRDTAVVKGLSGIASEYNQDHADR